MSRTADEKKFRVFARPPRGEFGLQLAGKGRVQLSGRELLPFNAHKFLAQWRKIRHPNKCPLGLCPDINQDGARILSQSFPNLLYTDVIDAFLRINLSHLSPRLKLTSNWTP